MSTPSAKLLEALNLSHISARPHYPKRDGTVVEAFKNFSRTLAVHLTGVTREKIEIRFPDEARIGQKETA